MVSQMSEITRAYNGMAALRLLQISNNNLGQRLTNNAWPVFVHMFRLHAQHNVSIAAAAWA